MELAYAPTDGSADPEGPAEYGGTLDFNGEGIAGCVRCGWRGIPTIEDGVRSVYCPACEPNEATGQDIRPFIRGLLLRHYPYGLLWLWAAPSGWLWRPTRKVVELATRRVEKVGRNAPCPCGSGKKSKKCCGR